MQRKRWAKGGLDADWWVHLLYAIVWLAHAVPLALVFLDTAVAMASIMALIASDAIVIGTMGRRVKHSPPWRAFAAFEAFLFCYTILMPLAIAVRPEIADAAGIQAAPRRKHSGPCELDCSLTAVRNANRAMVNPATFCWSPAPKREMANPQSPSTFRS